MSEAPGTKGAPPARRPWADLGPRLLSAAVLIVITVAGLYAGGYVFAALVGAVFAGCYREWERMVTLQPLTPVGGVLIGLLALAALLFPLWGPLATAAAVAVAVAVGAVADRSVARWRAGGLVFLGVIVTAALAIRGTGFDGVLAGVYLGVVVWMTDTGAFFTGRQIGGEKLAPDISPGKTWSGAIGGLAFGTLAGLVVWLIIVPASPWWIGLGFSGLISVLGQLGDLAESAIKRRFRIKDSGDIIPGHGGLMDRLDSLTFPLLLVFAVGLARGGIDSVAAGFLRW
ncbi:MAG TPA: phosphatidate cytidylyltransferase [Alphaproteobacteria bacterium]|nr:phosphatidate cytidylyltransferase [Alphaproteobacteria bacterium]